MKKYCYIVNNITYNNIKELIEHVYPTMSKTWVSKNINDGNLPEVTRIQSHSVKNLALKNNNKILKPSKVKSSRLPEDFGFYVVNDFKFLLSILHSETRSYFDLIKFQEISLFHAAVKEFNPYSPYHVSSYKEHSNDKYKCFIAYMNDKYSYL